MGKFPTKRTYAARYVCPYPPVGWRTDGATYVRKRPESLTLGIRFEITRRSFARIDSRGDRRHATGLRVDLIEDVAKPDEEENSKIRRGELLSFFTG